MQISKFGYCFPHPLLALVRIVQLSHQDRLLLGYELYDDPMTTTRFKMSGQQDNVCNRPESEEDSDKTFGCRQDE